MSELTCKTGFDLLPDTDNNDIRSWYYYFAAKLVTVIMWTRIYGE